MAEDRRNRPPARARVLAVPVVLSIAAAACGWPGGGDPSVSDAGLAREPSAVIEDAVAPTPADTGGEGAPESPLPPSSTTTTTTMATTTTMLPRIVTEQAWTPFAMAENLVLRHPSRRVERVGFHEANHDGARNLEPLPTAVSPLTLETRERGTMPRTAADIVVDPAAEIRAPVTGRVIRAGTYVLYCDHRDDYVVIEPDDRPGWEVKILHISGVMVRAGDRVVAAETVLAPGPTQLPFESQVDEVTAQPAWPHVHVEVVDPSIPDRPSPGGGGSSC